MQPMLTVNGCIFPVFIINAALSDTIGGVIPPILLPLWCQLKQRWKFEIDRKYGINDGNLYLQIRKWRYSFTENICDKAYDNGFHFYIFATLFTEKSVIRRCLWLWILNACTFANNIIYLLKISVIIACESNFYFYNCYII
jgi:hypothetical protein